ncbi:MAG: hypothetical protein WDN46_13460 [Methylocella sp.]
MLRRRNNVAALFFGPASPPVYTFGGAKAVYIAPELPLKALPDRFGLSALRDQHISYLYGSAVLGKAKAKAAAPKFNQQWRN